MEEEVEGDKRIEVMVTQRVGLDSWFCVTSVVLLRSK